MKYIIEIEDSPMFAANGDMLWRAKDFKSLVFDSDGLAKLQPYRQFILNANDANISNKQPDEKVDELKKAAIEAAKKLANAPVDKHKTDKTNKPEKKEESRKSNLRNSDCLTFSIGENEFLESIRTLIDTFF